MEPTPKEKALQLTHQFDSVVLLETQKRYAIICCDEILQQINSLGQGMLHYHRKKTINYWEAVKQEINLL